MCSVFIFTSLSGVEETLLLKFQSSRVPELSLLCAVLETVPGVHILSLNVLSNKNKSKYKQWHLQVALFKKFLPG